MSSSREIHVGYIPTVFPFEDRVLVHFHQIEQMPSTFMRSSDFDCAGHIWHLRFTRSPQGGQVVLSTHLQNLITVVCDIAIKNEKGDAIMLVSEVEKKFGSYNNDLTGILDERHLNKNLLTFEVRIRPRKDDGYYLDAEPISSLADNIFSLFNRADNADVAFDVKGEVFYAHKVIIKVQAPDLAELTEPFKKESPIPINDVNPEVFELMLKFVYGKAIEAVEWKEHSKQILDSSAKYGFSDLKSIAEAWYVKNFEANLTAENVIDELLYADGMSCPCLKNAAMRFIVDHGEEVLESDSYDKLYESRDLMREVMKASIRGNKKRRMLL